MTRVSSSNAPSESGECGGPSHSGAIRSLEHGEDMILLAADEEMNDDDVQEDNNNDEGMMMENRVVSN